MSHTFALLAVSKQTYDEIKAKLEAADYQHAFVDEAIDMHGIGLVVENTKEDPAQEQFDLSGLFDPTK